MEVKEFAFNKAKTHVIIIFENNSTNVIFLNEMSGKIICRSKIDSLLKLKHTGVYIGKDANGNDWVVHNHYLNKVPKLDLFTIFSKGRTVEEYKKIAPSNSIFEIIEGSLMAVIKAKPYNILNNCQHLVSKVATGKSTSGDLQKTALTVAFAGAITATASKNKFVRAIGVLSLITGLGVAIYDANRN